MVRSVARNYHHFGATYKSGFDRALADKLEFFKVFGGHWFALLGVMNIGAYFLSKTMKESDYNRYFGYTGELASASTFARS